MYLLPPPANCNHKPQDTGERAGLPLGFDCQQYPILSKHWPNWRPVGEVAACIIQRKPPDALIEAGHG